MTGRYVDQKRTLPSSPVKYRYAESYTKIDPEATQWQKPVGFIPAPIQETRSWRTSKSAVDVNHQGELEEDLRVMRNGFTSYDPTFDRGHTFRTRKQSVELSHPDVSLIYFDSLYGKYMMYQGVLVPNAPTLEYKYPVIPDTSSGERTDLGQRAILGSAPTKPHANVATAVLEILSDGLPAAMGTEFWKETLHSNFKPGRGAGSEYLNAQFGWVPLISDIRKTVSALLHSTKILSQLQRDSGRVVRRRFSFPPVISNDAAETVTYDGFPLRYMPTQRYAPPAPTRLVKTTRTYEKSWFSGAFQYPLMGYDSFAESIKSYEKMASVLLGGAVTPEVLWEIAPWSWAIDWKLKIGQFLSTQQLLGDGLVIRYGYLMRHREAEEAWIPKEPVRFKNGWTCLPSITLTTTVKERMQANPFGFATDLSNLSSYQWSILAALGLTKSPRTLRQVS